jgi:hypothetical protein
LQIVPNADILETSSNPGKSSRYLVQSIFSEPAALSNFPCVRTLAFLHRTLPSTPHAKGQRLTTGLLMEVSISAEEKTEAEG